MAIAVKVLDRPIEDVSYVRATLKGLALTFKHLIHPDKVTVEYPEQRDQLSARWRGTDHRGRQVQVCGVRTVPDCLPGQLHQAGAGRG